MHFVQKCRTEGAARVIKALAVSKQMGWMDAAMGASEKRAGRAIVILVG